jgi:hypothetical protein
VTTKYLSAYENTIAGRDETGRPISHAMIYLSAGQLPRPRITSTDAEGNFQITELDALAYSLSAAAPTYVMAPREPNSPTPFYRIGENVTINLIKGGVITGTVTSADGEPLVQAKSAAWSLLVVSPRCWS